MASCIDPTDPAHMTAEERVEELAAILAAGVLRLHRRAAVPAETPPSVTASDYSQGGLISAPERGFMDNVVSDTREPEHGDDR
ncbi:MAG: hypothetical protein IT442_17210 [Phycisphaeraceae bacterium]|nr:hypothetical protein [Phycisphaeraceae bacterium]